MGPNFDKGKTTINRKRLPYGLVAILDDAETLRLALRELHGYANDNRHQNRPRRGIIYRVVSEHECQSIYYRLQNLLGMKRFVDEELTYAVPVGHWHVIEDSSLSHAWNRHSDLEAEAPHGHLALTLDDLERLPEVIRPRNIVEFCVAKGMPRIVYEQTYADGMLRVVEEIQAKAGLSFKTMYKKR